EYDGSRVREQLGIPNGAPVLGCLANVLEIKGHDILLDAFANIVKVHSTVHLLLVGRDTSSYGAEMHALADRLGVAERTHFVGFQADVRPYIAAMNLVVLPSRSEGLPVALLECMAMAKPVVASAVGGIPEIVVDGVTGKLIQPEDTLALNSAMIELLSHPKLLREYGQKGMERVEISFALQSEINALESVYHHLLKDELSAGRRTSAKPALT